MTAIDIIEIASDLTGPSTQDNRVSNLGCCRPWECLNQRGRNAGDDGRSERSSADNGNSFEAGIKDLIGTITLADDSNGAGNNVWIHPPIRSRAPGAEPPDL